MTDDAQRAARTVELSRILTDARRLKEMGTHVQADRVLDLLIRYLELRHV